MKKKSSARSLPKAPIGKDKLRPFSSIPPWRDGPDRAPSRAMLYPVGFKEADFKKAVIGISSTWGMVTPSRRGGMHIDQLALEAQRESG